jgi:hypothetical protein
MLTNHSIALCIIGSREATLYSPWSAESDLMNGNHCLLRDLRVGKFIRITRRIWHQKWGTGRYRRSLRPTSAPDKGYVLYMHDAPAENEYPLDHAISQTSLTTISPCSRWPVSELTNSAYQFIHGFKIITNQW